MTVSNSYKEWKCSLYYLRSVGLYFSLSHYNFTRIVRRSLIDNIRAAPSAKWPKCHSLDELPTETCSVGIVSANTLQRAHQDRPHPLTHSHSIIATTLLVRSSCPLIKLYTDAQRIRRRRRRIVRSQRIKFEFLVRLTVCYFKALPQLLQSWHSRQISNRNPDEMMMVLPRATSTN